MARSWGSSLVGRLSGRLVAAAAIAAVTGCRPAPAKPPDPSIKPTYDARGRLDSLSYDRNHDGKPDAWLKMRGAHVLSADLDEDFDGKVDRREFYSDESLAANSGAPSGVPALPDRTGLVRVEQSTRGDGTMNRVEFYEHGNLVRVEEDTNGDGRVDKWETWTDGSLAVLALDTKGSGKPDRRIIYPADGGEVRMEVDTKGDGTFTPLAH
jgi:hypothetical protein